MSDNQPDTLNEDLSAQDLEDARYAVEGSYQQYGASDETRALVEWYVRELLSANPAVSSQIEDPGVREWLTARVMEELNVDDNQVIRQTIIGYLQGIASGQAMASTTPSHEEVSTAADPVQMFSGQFTHAAEDFRLRGAGIDFVFTRTYGHQATYVGPLGAKWDHPYNLWIREVGTNLFRSTGTLREDLYTRHPKFGQAGFNYWVPPPGQYGTIQERDTVDGRSFAWIDTSGLQHLYQPDGSRPGLHRVTRIQDRHGNYIALQYPDQRLRIAEVNSRARLLNFAYDSQDRIETIQDHTGRIWHYEYDNVGNLIRVTLPSTRDYPRGVTICYEYDTTLASQQNNLVTIIDPAGRRYVENEYGQEQGQLSYNRVVRQRMGNGESLFEYERVVEIFDADYTDEERPYMQVNFVQRNGHPIHYIYNRFGNLLMQEENVLEGGRLVHLQWRYRYNGDGNRIASLSPEGSLVQWYYGRDHYLRRHRISDSEVSTHDNLTETERRAFGNLLAEVRRGQPLRLINLNLAGGIWGDIFPDILGPYAPEDIIVKRTYEPVYQQPLTISDPRFTASANPGYGESQRYTETLTSYEYTGPPQDPTNDPYRLLAAIHYPDLTLPDGTRLSNVSTQFTRYDNNGRLGEKVDAEGTVTQFLYFPAGDSREGFLRREIIDPNGLAVQTTFEVNPVGLVTAVHHPRSVGAPQGQFITRCNVNELDQMVETISSAPFSFVERSYYDPSGLEVRKERDLLDENGNPVHGGLEVQTYCYDEEKKRTRETIGGHDDQNHLVTQYRYDMAGQLVKTIRPRGNLVRRRYDERMQETAVIRGFGTPEASTAARRYDGDGRPIVLISGRGYETLYRYDALGRRRVVEDPLGNIRFLTYDKAGNLTVERFFELQPNGSYALLERASYEYDELNRRIREKRNLFRNPLLSQNPETDYLSDPGPGEVVVTRFFYDRLERLEIVIDADGFPTRRDYDALGRMVRIVDATGNEIAMDYDAHGNLVRRDIYDRYTDPTTGQNQVDVFSAAYTYDTLDRLETETDSLGNVTSYFYDSRKYLVRTVDPLGNVVQDEYDVFGRRTGQIRERTSTGVAGSTSLAPVTVLFDPDANGNITTRIDGNGNTTRYRFDALDRGTDITYPDDTFRHLTYDPDDNVVEIVDANGVIRQVTFDPLGRKTMMQADLSGVDPQFPVEGSQGAGYAYDALGRMLGASNRYSDVIRKVDSLGRVYEETVQLSTAEFSANMSVPLVLTRRHNRSGFLEELTYPSGRIIHLHRDALHLIERIENVRSAPSPFSPPGIPDPHDILTVEFRGRKPHRYLYRNGAQVTLAYDGLGRVIQIEHTTPQPNARLTLQHLYDAVDNMRFRAERSDSVTIGEDFRYDSLYRLTRIVANNQWPRFDPVNIAPATAPSDPIPNRQAAINAVIGSMDDIPSLQTYVRDSASNRLQVRPPGQTGGNYQANNLNQYSQVAGTQLSYDPNGNLRQDGNRIFVYDVRNRLSQVRDAGANILVRLFHDALGRRIAEEYGGEVYRLVWDDDRIVEEYRDRNLLVQYVSLDSVDTICQMVQAGHAYWFHRDILGSTRLLTDGNGTVAAVYRFDPYGIGVVQGAVYNPYRFVGRRLTNGTGTYDFRARGYSPQLGRFLQRDPVGGSTDDNLYQYAFENPLRFADPFGTEPQPIVSDPTTLSFSTLTGEKPSRSESDDSSGSEKPLLATDYVPLSNWLDLLNATLSTFDEAAAWIYLEETKGAANPAAMLVSGLSWMLTAAGNEFRNHPDSSDREKRIAQGLQVGGSALTVLGSAYNIAMLAKSAEALALASMGTGPQALLLIGSFAGGYSAGSVINEYGVDPVFTGPIRQSMDRRELYQLRLEMADFERQLQQRFPRYTMSPEAKKVLQNEEVRKRELDTMLREMTGPYKVPRLGGF